MYWYGVMFVSEGKRVRGKPTLEMDQREDDGRHIGRWEMGFTPLSSSLSNAHLYFVLIVPVVTP